MTDQAGFGAVLRRLREAIGLTQEQLAERAGLSAKAVSLLERGERRRPYPHTVTALAEALQLSRDDRERLLASLRRPSPEGAPLEPAQWPVPPTPLVGRDRELREVLDLLARPETRLLTLTGTGGVGKTRLALAVLDLVADGFEAAAFVPLAPVCGPELVMGTVLQALGLSERGRDVMAALRDHLAHRRVLLVLDNVEHVLACATEVAELLALPGGPVVLATSRAPLRVRGEVELPVPPLWTPETETATLDAVRSSPSAQLFADRARAVSPLFELTEDNAADVAAICRHLAGIPLALEIVAARARILGPAQLLTRLGGGLHHEGARDLPERHRTLQHTLDWSHDLLARPTREVFAMLAVFQGGFSLEAAEALVAALPGERDALGALSELVDQSLVVADTVFEDAAQRYRMLEPVRQYAADKLARSGHEPAVRAAHARWFVALSESAYLHLMSGEQLRWIERLAEEHANLSSAVAWSATRGRPEVAVRLAWSLRMYWLLRDARQEGRRLLEQLLPRAEQLPAPTRARLYHVLAFCHYGYGGPQGDFAERARQLFLGLGDREGEQYATGQLGFAHLVAGDLTAAGQALQRALDLALELGDDPQTAHMLNHLAVVPLRTGDLVRATELAGQALTVTRRTGERLAMQTALQILGQAAWAQGTYGEARRLYRASLEVACELDDAVNVGYCLRGLAVADGLGGTSPDAARLLGAADRILRGAGYPTFAWTIGAIDAAVTAAERDGRTDPAWVRAYDEGHGATTDDAVHWARAPE